MFSSSLLAGVPNPRIWNRCATLSGQGCHQCVSWPRWITGCNQNICCTIAIHLEKKQVWGPDSAVEWVQCEWKITKTVTFSICETSFRESVTLACFRCPASVSFKSQFCTWMGALRQWWHSWCLPSSFCYLSAPPFRSRQLGSVTSNPNQ